MKMISLSLQDKVALVTGAGSGLGRGSVIGFLQAGAVTVATDIDAAGLEGTRSQALELGLPEPVLRVMDTSSSKAVQETMTWVGEQYGGLDCLHANAGVERYVELEHMQEVDLDLLLDVDLKGVLLAAQYAIPQMKKRGGGSMVFTSSVQATHSLPGCVVYAAAKAGVNAAARTLALEVGNAGIRVNSISPGTIDTPMLTRDLGDMNVGQADAFLESVRQANALHRIGDPQDVAAAVVFLCSDAASYITGTDLVVDAGFTAVKKF
jgi:NAD(P)-dependent dehydrogenase (short-subunit alcohol dehydrogenase family)